ncbi:MAG: translation initiation factor IF-2 [Clostridiales bacterium]|nr:translation initiation factor IF-2 [Clostridiales bacterium]
MTTKVHELAKELNLTSKVVLERLAAMGVPAKGPMSAVSDINATAIRNRVTSKKADTETKIVKIVPKKTEQTDEPRVVVKATTVKQPLGAEQKIQKRQEKPPERANLAKPPAGKPIITKELDSRPKPPVGTPVISVEISSRAVPRPDAPKPRAGGDGHQEFETDLRDAAHERDVPVKPDKEIPPAKADRAGETVDTVSNGKPPEADKGRDGKPDRPDREAEQTKADRDSRPTGADRDSRPPRTDRDGRPAGADRDSRPPRTDRDGRPTGADRDSRPPVRTDRDGKPPVRTDRDGKPVRTDRDGRPPRTDRDGRPTGADRDSRPPRTDRDGRPPVRTDRDGRPPVRTDRDGKPVRTDRDGRPPRTDRDGKPVRTDRDGRPPRTDRDGKPVRTDRDGKPVRTDRDGKPVRTDRPKYQNDRLQRHDAKADKPETTTGDAKTLSKRSDKLQKSTKDSKDHGKYAKTEQAKKPKYVAKERSLEKQPKPKKQVRQKPVVVEPEINMADLPVGTKIINVPITVAGFCEQVEVSTSAVIMSLMRLGIMANINQNIDEDTVLVLAEELGISVVIGKIADDVIEEGIELFKDKEEDLYLRPPIITVMGHVDHGKTSLLDAIRKTNVTASESGGITQHIGASEVTINGQKIVFLDTPGHEAFTAMRARGAHVTDIAVLVVAADDSVKPQTVESISHARAAGVPMIVAINKIDKPAANIDKVKQDLSAHGILVEDWGGSTISVPVSAKSGEGIVNLLEMILLQAEVLELKANPDRLASGTVIEARLDKAKGPVATLLVLNGTLQSGMSVVAGTCAGKIRLMTSFKGDTIKEAGPATAVEILGLTEVPEAGDEFNAVKEDRTARDIAEHRKIKLREEILARNASTTLEKLFSQIQEGEVKELNLIIKGDVQGSVGALEASLEKLRNENVRVRIIHSGVGTVTESDVMLAGTSGAVIIGFNVRPSTAVSSMADREKIEIRTYRVIYDAINDVEAAMKGMLDPVFKEVVLGRLEIRNIFKVPGTGNVGGAYVTDGKIARNAEIRLVRDGIVVHEGKIASLRRYKDDVKEVMQGFECGIGLENYGDIHELDIVECFIMEEIQRA